MAMAAARRIPASAGKTLASSSFAATARTATRRTPPPIAAAPARLVAGRGRGRVRLPAPALRMRARARACYSTVTVTRSHEAESPSASRAASALVTAARFASATSSGPAQGASSSAPSSSSSLSPSHPPSPPPPHTPIAALHRLFSQRGAVLGDALWAARLGDALSRQVDGVAARQEVVLVRLGGADHADLLRLMAEDALSDPSGSVPRMIDSARRAREGSGNELVLGYGGGAGGETPPHDEVLRLALPWLREANVDLVELQNPDPSSEDLASRLYAASQAYVSLSYTDVFSPAQPHWLPSALALLRRFAAHPGLHIVVSHDGQLRSQEEEHRAAAQLGAWIRGPTVAHVGAPITFVCAQKATDAQAALRGAMGFGAGVGEETVSSGTAPDSRSALWTRFQALSAQSGIPALIASIAASASSDCDAHLALLAQHAEEAALARLSLARSELDEYRALASYLQRSAHSETQRAVSQALASACATVEEQPQPARTGAVHEPPLLPSWWKLPFIGDAETRNRVHDALERDWLGGKAAEERLTWWGGRLKEMHGRETAEMQAIVDGLRSENTAMTSRPPATNSRPPATHRRILALPHTRLLEIRSLSPAYARDAPNFDDAALLAHPLIRARDHFFGRGRGGAFNANAAPDSLHAPTSDAAGIGPSPAEGGVSLLDVLQRRVQVAIYRFWATVGLSWGAAGWGLASHFLFHAGAGAAAPTAGPSRALLADILAYPSFSPSTSLALALLGSTLAFWNVQRAHARLARRLLTRDVLVRIPANVRADLQSGARAALQGSGGVYGFRRGVGAVLQEWVAEEEGRLSAERQALDAAMARRTREG